MCVCRERHVSAGVCVGVDVGMGARMALVLVLIWLRYGCRRGCGERAAVDGTCWMSSSVSVLSAGGGFLLRGGGGSITPMPPPLWRRGDAWGGLASDGEPEGRPCARRGERRKSALCSEGVRGGGINPEAELAAEKRGERRGSVDGRSIAVVTPKLVPPALPPGVGRRGDERGSVDGRR